MISKVWSSCLQGSQSCRRLDPRKRSQQVPRARTRLPALPKARTQAKGDTINHGAMRKQHDAKHGMICGMGNAMHMVLWKENI